MALSPVEATYRMSLSASRARPVGPTTKAAGSHRCRYPEAICVASLVLRNAEIETRHRSRQHIRHEHLRLRAGVLDRQIPWAVEQGRARQFHEQPALAIQDQQRPLLDALLLAVGSLGADAGAPGARHVADQHQAASEHA